jgi:hypothetical protein
MELAIPLIALGGMYVISNQTPTKKENFSSSLPNVSVPPRNYPILNNKELTNVVDKYPNVNTATNDYLNQNEYQLRERQGKHIDNNIPQVYSLTGEYISSDQFTHNNMVPFNGKKPRGQIYNNNNAETILDSYSGGGSQVLKKTEQAPLFKPQDNVQWNFGMPNVSDFIQSRQNPVNKNAMVKPFESIHVGPGLDKGYGTDGNLGFNSGLDARDKWMPKSVDELRVATNPKQEYDLNGLQGPAQSSIKNVGIEGRMEKNRPDTFFINTQDRWLTTTGAEKASQMIPEHIVKPSIRNETSSFQQGTPNSILKTASYVPTNYEETKKLQLEGLDVGHSVSKAAPLQHESVDKHLKSHTNYANNRSVNTQPESFGSGFSRAMGAVIAPIMDILKPSRKEEYSQNVRQFGNLAGEVPSNYVVSQGDQPGITIKETTLYEPNGFINNQKDNAGYLLDQQRPIVNQRLTMNHDHFMGASSKLGNRQYDSAYRQTNNEFKETTIVSRPNIGNAKHFNPQMNVSIAKNEADRFNNRASIPKSTIANGPSRQTHGVLNSPPIYEQPNDNRISPDLLTAFKQNPYTHSLSSVA